MKRRSIQVVRSAIGVLLFGLVLQAGLIWRGVWQDAHDRVHAPRTVNEQYGTVFLEDGGRVNITFVGRDRALYGGLRIVLALGESGSLAPINDFTLDPSVVDLVRSSEGSFSPRDFVEHECWLRRVDYGWPLRCARAQSGFVLQSDMRPGPEKTVRGVLAAKSLDGTLFPPSRLPKVIPAVESPLNLLANAVLLGAPAYALLWRLPLIAFGWVRRRIRRSAGRCAVCGYELDSRGGHPCPECGA